MNYPDLVQDEWATLRELTLGGKSIARFGDGEFKMMDGAGYVREPPNKKLAAELRSVLRNPHPNLIRGIPTMDPRGDKYHSWARHKQRFAKLLRKTRGPYFSAFISRPDSAQWIRTREFALEFAKLWAPGRRVGLLCEKESSAKRAIGYEVGLRPDITWVECPSHGAYAEIDDYEKVFAAVKPDVVFMACGPTAKCLAQRLTRRGIQAIDFGSSGAFLAKLLAEEPA